MDANVANAFLEVAYPVISSAALAASRAMGVVVITPAFNRLGLTGMIRGCVAVAIAIPVAIKCAAHTGWIRYFPRQYKIFRGGFRRSAG